VAAPGWLAGAAAVAAPPGWLAGAAVAAGLAAGALPVPPPQATSTIVASTRQPIFAGM